MYIGQRVQYRLFLSRFLMKYKFSRQTFDKYFRIKFHENPLSGNRVVPCGMVDRRTDVTKLIVALPNFSNAPRNKQEPYAC